MKTDTTHHGDSDPHALNDANNVLIYVDNIAQGLADADPANAVSMQPMPPVIRLRWMQLDMCYKIRFNALPEARAARRSPPMMPSAIWPTPITSPLAPKV